MSQSIDLTYIRRRPIRLITKQGVFNGNAIKLQGVQIDDSSPTNYQVLVFIDSENKYVPTLLDHTKHLLNVGSYSHPAIDSHIDNNSNPHSVTAIQIGANNLINEINSNGTIVLASPTEAAPTSNKQYTNKKYVDDEIASAISGENLWDRDNGILSPHTPGDDVKMTGDFLSDRYLDSPTNLFLGKSAAGAGNLSHGSGVEGYGNVGIGNISLYSITTGAFNTAVGFGSAQDITSGYYNTACGQNSLSNLTTGDNNCALGLNALFSCLNGSYNSALGNNALYEIVSGRYNTGVGSYSLGSIEGNFNVGIGFRALYNNNSGDSNVAIGSYAGHNNQGGSCVFIGYKAGYDEAGNNRLYIANSETESPLIYGEFDNKLMQINGQLFIQVDFTDIPALSIYEPDGSIGIEFRAGKSGGGNTYIGEDSGKNDTGIRNTAFGRYAYDGENTGVNNTAIGYRTLSGNTTGGNNTALGCYALQRVTTGGNNTGLSANCLARLTTGGNNLAMGFASFYGLTSESNNVGIGAYTSYMGIGHRNTIIGSYACGRTAGITTNITNNVIIGYMAAYNFEDMEANTIIGSNAGYSITTGSSNVLIGNSAGYDLTTESNKLYISNSKTNNLIYGEFDNKIISFDAKIGINTKTPSASLEIIGSGNSTSTKSFEIFNSDGRSLLYVNDRGYLMVNEKPSDPGEWTHRFQANGLFIGNEAGDYGFELVSNVNRIRSIGGTGRNFYLADSGGDRITITPPNGYVGIGTTTPQNRLDVSGSVIVGSSYAGTDTAEADGLMVEGITVIGRNAKLGSTNGATGKLQILGDIDIGSPGTGMAKINFWTYPTLNSLPDGYIGIQNYKMILAMTANIGGNSYKETVTINGHNYMQSGAVDSSFLKITGTITQSGTSNYVGLLMDINESSTGSGNNKLMDLRIGGSSRAYIDNLGEMKIKVYSQASEPTLNADDNFAFWKDTDDSNKVYLVFRRGSADQVKIQLT